MEAKPKFEVIFSEETVTFLKSLPDKVREKIVMNVMKSKYNMDPKLFKKLSGTDIWEFRTLANGTPMKEIARAEAIRNEYFKSKNDGHELLQRG